MTSEQWRKMIEDATIFYAPLDIIDDWEREANDFKDMIKKQEIIIIDLKEELNDCS